MPEIYVPDGEDPLTIYRNWKKRGWWTRQSKGKILKVGLVLGAIGAGLVWLGWQLMPLLSSLARFGIGG